MSKLKLITVAILVTGAAIWLEWTPIQYWAMPLYFRWQDSQYQQAQGAEQAPSPAADNSPSGPTVSSPRARLEGWDHFKFGMSREQLLMVGGSEHHSAADDTEIWYPAQIGDHPYKATLVIPSGNIEAIVLERQDAAAAASKQNCFELATQTARSLDDQYGAHDKRSEMDLGGGDLVVFSYQFEDGNSIVINGSYSSFCRLAVIYGSNHSQAPQHTF
jgi:hypothetical protein